MPSVRCHIWQQSDETIFVEIEIGRDDADNPYWTLMAYSPVTFPQFTAKEGTWNYYKTLRTLKINSDDGNTEEFSLRGVPQSFYLRTCGQDEEGQGKRPPDVSIAYRIQPLCKPRTPPRPKKRGRAG